ncbi:MAG: SGNH/GDSL hydrolase family protein, partial [Anaerolineae bacterium]|nr:SGNH/GDSL hydrolase family protein [Anaerolineae bacterium]
PLPCQIWPGEWHRQVRELLTDYRDPCTQFYWMPEPTDEFHALVRLNNFGLHAPDYALDKPADTYRLLVVGDSFPQGMQVVYEQTFPYLLSSLLHPRSGQRVEVINLSVDAYGTDRELLLYALLGWRFQPDAVLLSIYMGNDVYDNHINLEERRYGYRLERPFFTLEDETLRLHNSPTFDAAQFPNAPPYQWLMRMQSEQSPAPPPSLPARPAVIAPAPNYALEYPVDLGLYLPEDEHWADAWALTEALILQFRDLVTAQDIPFAALIVPDRRAVHTADWAGTVSQYAAALPELEQADPVSPPARMEDFLTAQGIPTLNLTWTLRSWAQSYPDGRLYYAGDGHFNAEGHRVSAERIALWLTSQNIPG